MGIFDLFGPPNVEKMLAKKDVEGLIKALQHKEVNICAQAARTLGEIGDTRAVDPLISALKDKDYKNYLVRKAGAKALGKIGDARAVEPLIIAFRVMNEDMRRVAAEALIKLGIPAVEPLIAVLRDEDSDVRKVAAETLDSLKWQPENDTQHAYHSVAKQNWSAAIRMGQNAVNPLLIAALKDRKWEVREAATVALGKIGDARAVEPLIAALRSDDGNVRREAAETLEKIKPDWSKSEEAKKQVPEFILSLRYGNESQIKEAAETLIKIGIPAIELLIAALRDKACGHGAVTEVLGKINPDWPKSEEAKKQITEFVSALKDKEWVVRDAAAEALEKINPDWPKSEEAKTRVPEFISALNDKDYGVRRAAVDTLGKIGDARAVEPLFPVIRNYYYEPDLSKAASKALQAIDDIVAVEPLIKALRKDEDSSVRQSAATALGSIGDARATEPLLAAIKEDKAFIVVEAAAKALGKIGDFSGVAQLFSALNDEVWDRRHSTLIVLGEIGDVRAVDPLISLIKRDVTLAETTMNYLCRFIEKSAAEINVDCLQKIAQLSNISYKFTPGVQSDDGAIYHHPCNSKIVPLDCSHLQQLARQELIRRGIDT